MNRAKLCLIVAAAALLAASCFESNPQPAPEKAGGAEVVTGMDTGTHGGPGADFDVDEELMFVSAPGEGDTVLVFGEAGSAAGADGIEAEAEGAAEEDGAFSLDDDGSFVVLLTGVVGTEVNLKFTFPEMDEEEVRKIFARLNRNVVALNSQELRNATYWGPFISTIQKMADEDGFWAQSGVFSANDHRRMIDHEYISELVVAFLHGPQNKKDKLEHFYQLYEQEFEQAEELEAAFSALTGELAQALPSLKATRWRKKSDFYTLFLCLAERVGDLPMASDQRDEFAARVLEFGEQIDALVRMEETEWVDVDPRAAKYARRVSGAASDRGSRVARAEAFNQFVFGEAAPPVPAPAPPVPAPAPPMPAPTDPSD